MTMARDLRRMGSAAIDLAYVAAGRLDGFFERGLNPWDFAAGAILVQAAGGSVSRLELDRPRPMLIAGGPAVYGRLLDLVGEGA
jgi:myo-inositol-1(or 4)-monophosphatase